MKPTQTMRKIGHIALSRLSACTLIVSLVSSIVCTSVTALPAYAARATPPPRPTPEAKANINAHLTNVLGREKMWFNVQTGHLNIANEVVKTTQTWIDDLKARGKDTSTRETALNAFKQQIAAAQAAHDTAGHLLDAHAGFDDSGNVTDAGQARQTLKDAHKALGDAHRVLRLGRADFVKVIQQWREANR